MNTFLAIVRWLFGLLFGFVLLLAVLITIPLSIAGRELFNRQSGMAWLTAFTNDETAVNKFIDGTLEGIATSNLLEDPVAKDAVKLAADNNSPMGSALRKVLTPESVGINLLANADAFYSWLDGKKETLVWTYHLGGTPADQTSLIVSVLKYRYDSLPHCSPSELKEISKVNASNITMVPCSIGPVSSRLFEDAAKKMLADPEAKKLLANGFTSNAKVTPQTRTNMLELKQLLGKGILMCWLAIVLTSLFMILLFTPQGTNFIATGIIIGGIGLLVLGLGQGMGTISSVVKETLGREIARQGLYIGGYGLLLTVIGIWQLIAKKKPVVTDVAKKVEPATVPAKSSTQAKAG